MATPTQATINALTQADLDILVAAANQKFIDEADAVMAIQATFGKFSATFHLAPYVSCKDIANYYIDLGYKVRVPGCWQRSQPAALFGDCWIAYWNNSQICRCKKACKITISWK